MSRLLFTLALFGFFALPLASCWTKPWFCHDQDCPVFRSLNDTQQWETRVYEGGTFIRTKIIGRSLAKAEFIGFQRLMDYMNGNNQANMKLDQTVPVITRIKPNLASNEYTIHIFLPYSHQKDAPLPNDQTVELIHYNQEFPVAVRSFEGFGLDVLDQLQALQDILESNSAQYNSHTWFFAGYDKLTRLTNRHNEVWLHLKQNNKNSNKYNNKKEELIEQAKQAFMQQKDKIEEDILTSPLQELLKVEMP